MIDWLADAARRRPDHLFLVARNGSVGFADFEDRVSSLARRLSSRAVAGRIVSLPVRNDIDSVAGMFAAWRAGAGVHLVDPRLPTDDVEAQLRRVGSVGTVGPDPGDEPISGLARGGPTDEGNGGRLGPRHPEDTAWVVFTSGSTGRPKGAVLTFANLEASAAASATALAHGPDDRWLCTLPLSHVGGASILIRSARQATTVVLEPTFDPESSAALLQDGRASMASFVTATLEATMDRLSRPCRGVRAVLVGGGPVPDEVIRRAHGLGLPAVPTYGMTETASQVATRPLGEASGGMAAVPGAEIAIDEAGVIVIRGPMVSPGYLEQPDARPGSRPVDRGDAWLVTGDLGRIDGAGRLEVLGRADDVIVTGGELVLPSEVEASLRGCPGVDEVVVFGTSDPRWGAVVTAAYTGSPSPGQLERHARYRLAGFQVPRRWVHLDEIPRLGNGKIDRRRLRAANE